MGNDVEVIRWVGFSLCILGLFDIYVVAQASKLVKKQNENIQRVIEMSAMICIAITDAIHSVIWGVELALSSGTIDDGWCAALGFFLHYTSVLGLFWHFVLSLLPFYQLKLMKKFMEKLADSLLFMVFISMGLLVVGIMISIFVEHNTFGHRCLYKHDDTCYINECWIKEGYDWFWFVIGSLVGVFSFGVALCLCQQCCFSQDKGIGRYFLESLLPWLIKFSLFRGANISMRIYLEVVSHHRFSFAGVCFLIIIVSLYGISTVCAWLRTDHLLKKMSREGVESYVQMA